MVSYQRTKWTHQAHTCNACLAGRSLPTSKHITCPEIRVLPFLCHLAVRPLPQQSLVEHSIAHPRCWGGELLSGLQLFRHVSWLTGWMLRCFMASCHTYQRSVHRSSSEKHLVVFELLWDFFMMASAQSSQRRFFPSCFLIQQRQPNVAPLSLQQQLRMLQ